MPVDLIAHVPPSSSVVGGPVIEGFFKAHIHAFALAEVPFVTVDFIEFGQELGIRVGEGRRCCHADVAKRLPCGLLTAETNEPFLP